MSRQIFFKKIILANNYLTRNFWLSGLIILALSVLFFCYLQNFTGLVDPDSFYHAKMALLVKQGTLLKEFPWLPLTMLKDNFANQHFLYHIFLIPFVSFFPPLLGLKLSAIFFASLAVLAVAWLIYRKEPKATIAGALLLFSSAAFLFRAGLAKAPMLSVVLLLLIFYFLRQRRNGWVFGLSFFFVWLHGSWPLVLVLVVINNLVNSLFFALESGQYLANKFWLRLKRFFPLVWFNFWAWLNFRQIILIITALTAGVIINPFFPQNLKFYWQQIGQIAIYNYASQIKVGGEWYPFGVTNLISQNNLLFAVFIFLMVLWFMGGWRCQKRNTIVLGWLTLFFLALTLRAARNIEYFVPLFLLFIVFSLADIWQTRRGLFQKINDLIAGYLKNFSQFKSLIVGYFVVALIFAWLFGLISSHRDLASNRIDYFYLAGASQWLKNNTTKGSLVFHDNWSTWPEIWYYNDHNVYLLGLDPTFLYLQNPTLYQEMVSITLGEQKQDLWRLLKQDFKAQYVLIDKYHQDFLINILRDAGFKRVYQDSQAYIFEVL
ncbi:MAG: hypothetical protein WCW02_03395 [Candidatus Buchananbacteria bacterium]